VYMTRGLCYKPRNSFGRVADAEAPSSLHYDYWRGPAPMIAYNEKKVQPNWASGYERHTFLFEQAVIDRFKASKNQTKTAQLIRFGFNIVNRILHLSTERGMKRRNYSQVNFEHLSIDEKSFKKGHITSPY
jgi:hypothetical protein